MAVKSLTDVGERIALDAVANGKTLWVGLYSTVGSSGGAPGTELTAAASAYVRKSVTFRAAQTTAGITSTKNSNEVRFDPAGNNWGNVQGIGIFDAASGGDALWYGGLAAAKNITTGDVLIFEIDAIELTMD